VHSRGALGPTPACHRVCSRLAPDFAFVESWGKPTQRRMCQAIAGCGTVPFWVVRGPLDAVASERGWSETLAAHRAGT
jgi:hypothetical protein